MSDPDELEAFLEEQLLEHNQSVIEVNAALESAPDDEELLQLKIEIEGSAKEVEKSLLEIKRDRLLEAVKKLQDRGAVENSDQQDVSSVASSTGESSEITDDSDIFNDPDGQGAIFMESASQAARDAVIMAAEDGQQRETELFADWEAHGRGVASRLMAKMGYVRGKGLGRDKQGVVDAIVPKSSAKGDQRGGLGLNSMQGVSLKKKQRRGGRQHTARRKRKAAEEALKDDQHARELASGDVGLFQVINQAAGDNSEAAKILQYTVSDSSVRVPGEVKGDPIDTELDRKSIVGHQDRVQHCKRKVLDLKKMLERNKDQKELCTSLKVVLNQAEAALRDAKGVSDRLTAEINKRDELKKWVKF